MEPRTTEDVHKAVQRQRDNAAARSAETDDLWERARRGFTFSEALDHDRVEHYIEHYRQHPEIVRQATRRAQPFAYFILSEIEERGMPAELLLLPIVESGFSPGATSRSRAAGIWQFMPATGDSFELTRDAWYDGRRDVHRSTLAALDYLERLHSRFDDWYLALTAYNYGQGNLARTIQRHAARGEPTDYWSLDLPPEPNAYVARLLALRAIFLKPDRHDVHLEPIANEPAVEIIEPDRHADLYLLAELAGLEEDALRDLNPGYQRHTTHPDGPRHLFVPHAAVETLQAALEAHVDKPLIRFREYTVRAGDNLGQIARRTSTRVGVLRDMNDLDGDLIRAGQTLRLPVTARGTTDRVRVAADGRKADTIYQVQAGDSLWRISRRTGMSIRALRAVNELEPGTVLQPGDILRVAQAEERDETSHKRRIEYEIRRGDSLAAIARRHRVSIADLRRWNGLNGNGIRAGETLTLYLARAFGGVPERSDT